jgi:hypothetical protein
MASAVAMDKLMTKRIWLAEGLSTPAWRQVHSGSDTRAAFAALGEAMKPAMDERMAHTRSQLLEVFDAEVHERLRLQQLDTHAHLDRFSRRFWDLTRHVLQDQAWFDGDALSFELNMGDQDALAQRVAQGEPSAFALLHTGQARGEGQAGLMALIHQDPGGPDHEPRNALWSAFPFFGDGRQVLAEVEEIGVFPNRIEARLRLGLSTHGYAEMMRADALSPSYIAMGAVFPTTLKNMPTAPQGLGRLGAYAKLMQGHSLVAIGGIDEARFADVRRTGVGSIAVVRALVAAADPEATARDLMQLLTG